MIDVHRFVVQAVGLGADVDGQLRALLPQFRDDAQIRHDNSVRADLLQAPGVTAHLADLAVFREAVDGDVQLFAPLVGVNGGLLQLLKGKARAAGPQLQQGPAAVDGVRAEVQGGLQCFHAPRGSQ